VGKGITVEDEEAKAYYEEHRSDYTKPPRVHLSQITVADEAEAERLAGLLREGADMAWLARQHSIDRFKDAGGARGWTVPARGADPLQDALFEAEPGAVLGPMGFPGNYIVTRVDAREDQGYYEYERVKSQVQSAIYTTRYRVELEDVIQTLRKRSKIEIHQDTLAKLRITGKQLEDEASSSGAPHGH
jgi:parvulin-like peptidyl-prolyl isomerase